MLDYLYYSRFIWNIVVIFDILSIFLQKDGAYGFDAEPPFTIHSRKRAERTSLGTINFSVFRRAKSCKVILSGDLVRLNPSKIYSS